MQLVLDALSWSCLLGGSFFCLVGAIGLHRMPDFFTRGHAAGITDTLGAGLVLIGLMFQAGLTINLFKLLMILIFMLLVSPTGSHALAKAALANGLRPRLADGSEGPLELLGEPRVGRDVLAPFEDAMDAADNDPDPTVADSDPGDSTGETAGEAEE
jgi:multicomponent Na+:H+ antiporter subunit G